MLILSDDDVRGLLPMDRAIAVMRDAFAALSDGRATVPVRTRFEAAETGLTTLCMPSCLPGIGVGIKVVSVQPANAARGLPTIQGVMVLVDPETGRPVAVMDAEVLTAIRTGAASGLATDLLARPESSVVAVFGAGTQAATQLEAVCAVRSIARALVFSRSAARARAFATRMHGALGVEVLVAERPAHLRTADIICTATTAASPVLDEKHVSAGAHINGVGSFRPDTAELPADLVRGATVVADHRPSCLAEAGDLLLAFPAADDAARHVHAELGEIVLGRAPGRRASDEITLFKSVGNAAQDVAAAAEVVRRAVEAGRGAFGGAS